MFRKLTWRPSNRSLYSSSYFRCKQIGVKNSMDVFLDSKASSKQYSQQDFQRSSQLDTLRRSVLASLGAILYSLVFTVCFHLGYVQIEAINLLILFLFFWVGHFATLGFVIYRFSRGMPAPSTSLVHMIWAIIFVSILLYHTIEIRASLMMAYLTILSFGAFRIQRRGFFGISLFILASYAITIFLFQLNDADHWSPELEFITGISFLTAMLAFCILGSEFSLLRERLAMSNRELIEALAKIETLEITDDLTGLSNRSHLFDSLDKQRALANRDGNRFVLAFVDVDNFKVFNEQFGNQAGDDVLRQFAELLQESVREVDLAARYNDTTFGLLLNGVGLETAAIVVERIRLIVETMSFSEQNFETTVSVGITEYQAPEAVCDTSERADRLLHKAKKEGCNRVVKDLASERKGQMNLLS